jgi:hypothetical protein
MKRIDRRRHEGRGGSQNGQLKAKKAGFATSQDLSKVTLYVRPDQVIGVEAIQLAERKRTGQRPDKSALVQEALDLLISKYRRKQ